MSSFLDRLGVPIRWRRIGIVHITAATGIIGGLKYFQYQHRENAEKKRLEDMANRRRKREEYEQQQREQEEEQAAAAVAAEKPADATR